MYSTVYNDTKAPFKTFFFTNPSVKVKHTLAYHIYAKIF